MNFLIFLSLLLSVYAAPITRFMNNNNVNRVGKPIHHKNVVPTVRRGKPVAAIGENDSFDWTDDEVKDLQQRLNRIVKHAKDLDAQVKKTSTQKSLKDIARSPERKSEAEVIKSKLQKEQSKSASDSDLDDMDDFFGLDILGY
jgi:hypothetical protein